MANNIPKIPESAKLDILSYKDGKYVHQATLTLRDGQVEISGDQSIQKKLSKGLEQRFSDSIVKPSDGYAFLMAVTDVFDGPGMMATEIEPLDN